MEAKIGVWVALAAVFIGGVTGIVAAVFRRFYVSVEPDEFVVHYRGGRVRHLGRGLSFLCLPYDTFLKVPSTIRDLNFCADQITKEKQGVRVQGFLAYKITDFELAYQNLDLKAKVMRVLPHCAENIEETEYREKTKETVIPLDPGDPLAKTDLVLRRLAESVVRHEVSNKSVEEMITEREAVVQSMKAQLQATVADWGIEIDTIEFTEVWIRSKELFESLQADYRNEMRRKAALSNAETERQIAEKRIQTQAEVAALEAESERRARVTRSEQARLARTTEIADTAKVQELEATAQHADEVDRRAKAAELETTEIETARRLQELAKARELEAIELERREAEARAKTELERAEAAAARRRVEVEARARETLRLAEVERAKAAELAEATKLKGAAEAAALRLKVEAGNAVRSPQLQQQFIKELPQIAEAMRVKDVKWVNLSGGGAGGEDPLGIVPRGVANLLGVVEGMGVDLSGIAGRAAPQPANPGRRGAGLPAPGPRPGRDDESEIELGDAGEPPGAG